MSKPESAACAALDDDFTAMERAVMSAACRDEIVRVVTTAVGARANVVQIEKRGGPTTWHDAAPAVATQHRPAHGRRHVLPGTSRGSGPSDHVDIARAGVAHGTDALRVALGHAHDLRAVILRSVPAQRAPPAAAGRHVAHIFATPHASMVEACGLGHPVLARGGVPPGETVAVLGAGKLGLAVLDALCHG